MDPGPVERRQNGEKVPSNGSLVWLYIWNACLVWKVSEHGWVDVFFLFSRVRMILPRRQCVFVAKLEKVVKLCHEQAQQQV